MANSWFKKEEFASVITVAVTGFIRLYQSLCRGFLPSACRFSMSCSDYSLWAIRSFGLTQGLKLSLGRVLSCHPFYKRTDGA